MSVNYPAVGFEQLPAALDDQYVAGISCSAIDFDQQASTLDQQVGEVADWGMKIVRINDHDTHVDYEPNLATAQATSADILDHEANLIEACSSRGMYVMLSGIADRLCSSLGPIDKDSTIRSLFDAAGFPVTGSGGLYDTLGYGTGDAWAADRGDARRVIYDIMKMH